MTTLNQIATALGGKVWEKGDIKRIYLNRGYNTKKMTTKVYVYQCADGSYAVNCRIECPNQIESWIKSQEQQIIESVTSDLNDALAELNLLSTVSDSVAQFQQELAAEEQVQGYYMQWREVRVAINRFGKLAERKRMFVVTYQGPKSIAPARLIACNDAEFALALEAATKETAYEYGNEPSFVVA